MEQWKYRSRADYSNRALSAADTQLLKACFAFRTLADHASYLARLPRFAALGSQHIYGRLLYFQDAKLLIREDEFRALICAKSDTTDAEVTSIEMIGIQRADRPAELRRLFESLIPNLAKYHRTPEIVVSDDSSAASFSANSAMLKQFSAQYGGKISHLDQPTRQADADKVADELKIDPKLCRLILCPDRHDVNRCGAGRNTLLLRGTGRKMLMLDDDVIIRTHRVPNLQKNLTLSSSFQNGYSYFDSAEAAIAYFPTEELDYIGLHETWLGRKVSEMLTAFEPAEIQFEKLPGGFNDKMFTTTAHASTSDARITFTHSGSVGDSWGRYHSNFDASLPGPHDLFGSSPEQFTRNMTTPFVSRIDDSLVLYNGPVCISLNMGIDARETLPPFTPLYRAQDNLFGCIGALVMPPHFSVRFPCAVEHIRKQTRGRNDDPFAYLLSLGSITKMFLEMYSPTPNSDVASNLRSMGQFLLELSKTSEEDLKVMITSEISKRVRGACQFATYMLAHYEGTAPQWWIDNVTALSRSADAHIARVSSQPLFADEPHIDFNGWLADLGNILDRWPDIFAYYKK